MTNETVEQAPGDKQQGKRRAACDECRLKKLKCTGEQAACSRCVRETINCVYSVQKQMGRPKKRQRSDGEGNAVDAGMNGGERRGRGREAARVVLEAGVANDVDLGALDAFDPSFEADAWLLPPPNDWDTSRPALPSLTSDSSSNTPPLLNLPPELRNTTHHPSHSHGNNSDTNDTSTQLLLDPTLNPPATFPDLNLGHPSDYPTCACLSSIYLTLNTLSSTSTTFSFPFALHPLREAMQTASSALVCVTCPQRFITGIQNTQLLSTLLMSIAERFAKTLASINEECARAEEGGQTKKFRLADLSTPSSHLHTGGLGCAAAFSIALSPREWKTLAKKVVRAEVHGASDGNKCCVSLMSLIDDMRERQARFHRHPPIVGRGPGGGDMAAGLRCGSKMWDWSSKARDGREEGEGEHLCQKVAGVAGKMVGEFDWD